MPGAELRAGGRQRGAVLGRAAAGAVQPAGRAAGGAGAARVRAARAGAGAALQVLLLRAHQRAERLVPVRGAQVRLLPYAGSYPPCAIIYIPPQLILFHTFYVILLSVTT